MATQDVAEGRFADRHAQFFQLPVQLAAAPTVLACQSQNQRFHFGVGSRASASISR